MLGGETPLRFTQGRFFYNPCCLIHSLPYFIQSYILISLLILVLILASLLIRISSCDNNIFRKKVYKSTLGFLWGVKTGQPLLLPFAGFGLTSHIHNDTPFVSTLTDMSSHESSSPLFSFSIREHRTAWANQT